MKDDDIKKAAALLADQERLTMLEAGLNSGTAFQITVGDITLNVKEGPAIRTEIVKYVSKAAQVVKQDVASLKDGYSTDDMDAALGKLDAEARVQ